MLVDEISADRDWRMRDLAFIKKLDKRLLYGHLTQDELKIYYRMCIPTIYAHWEGFMVSSFKNLISFINSQNLTKDELKNEIFAFSHKDTFSTLAGKQSFKQRCEFSQKFLSTLIRPVKVDTKLFTTKSNLNYEMLEEALSWFCIDIQPYKKHKDNLNKLVNIRNAIAHGENSVQVSYLDIENYIKMVNELLDITIVCLDSYLSEELYKIEVSI